MASLKGTIIVTGSNGGLGCALVSKIISMTELSDYYSIYTVRSALSSATNLQSVLSSAPKTCRYDVQSLDLSRLANVREFADNINARVAAGEIPPIRALILNAAMNDMGKQSFTEDGFDTGFASNYLSHWLLTLLLLQSMDHKEGRILVVGSAFCILPSSPLWLELTAPTVYTATDSPLLTLSLIDTSIDRGVERVNEAPIGMS